MNSNAKSSLHLSHRICHITFVTLFSSQYIFHIAFVTLDLSHFTCHIAFVTAYYDGYVQITFKANQNNTNLVSYLTTVITKLCAY